ncbi:hypothetical protein 7S11_9 [uncultured Caudovirales phage]|uniref:Portal protein n=1 Tax=uncultured Caudovirales phage TaxID=2100421 RepID=A0A2H4J2P6_9CAUD|nr:hypothetical protein 7S11_9 [uncultured Caudovirales phage]
MTNKIVLPDLKEDENALLGHLLEQLDTKSRRNLLRASYYDGKRAIRQVGSVIPPQYYRLGLVLGWTAKAVDILARRCNLDGFVWPDGDLDSLGAGEVWDSNFLAAESNSAVVSSLIHGVSFLVNTQGADSEPKSLIHVKDALSATGDWNSRRRAMDNLLSITGRDDKGDPTSLALYLYGETITAVRDGGKWEVDRSPHPWGVPVEPLVYKPRVGRPFGSSRISRDAMSMHDAALRTVIRMEGHADVYSFPEMWMLGADESIFKNEDGSPKASWQVMLGRIKGIPDDEDAENPRADVKQFPAQSPGPHLDMLKMHASLFAGAMDIPATALGIQAETNTTTADGSDNAERQLIAEAEGATDDWGPAVRRSMMRSLAIVNEIDAIPAEWRTIDAKWRNPQYLSRAAEADAGAKQLGTAPWLAETSVGLELLGLSDQQIKRAMAERRRASGRGVLDALRKASEERARRVTADAVAE